MTAFTPEHAAVLVRGHTPLAADEVRELCRGADSVAFLVDATWVFRFPMVANARTTLRREVALLPLRRSALPLPTPHTLGCLPPSGGVAVQSGAPMGVDRVSRRGP